MLSAPREGFVPPGALDVCKYVGQRLRVMHADQAHGTQCMHSMGLHGPRMPISALQPKARTSPSVVPARAASSRSRCEPIALVNPYMRLAAVVEPSPAKGSLQLQSCVFDINGILDTSEEGVGSTGFTLSRKCKFRARTGILKQSSIARNKHKHWSECIVEAT